MEERKKSKAKSAEQELLKLVAQGVSGLALRDQLRKLVCELEEVGFSQAEVRDLLQRTFWARQRERSRDFHLRLRSVTKGATVRAGTRQEQKLRREKEWQQYKLKREREEISDERLLSLQLQLEKVQQKRREAGLPDKQPTGCPKLH